MIELLDFLRDSSASHEAIVIFNLGILTFVIVAGDVLALHIAPIIIDICNFKLGRSGR